MAETATRKSRRLPVLLAAVGLLSSILLQILHLRTFLTPSAASYCSFHSSFDCALVAASPSSVFVLPWATWGILGFTSILIAAVRRSAWLWPLSLVAALVSIALFVVEITRVGSICLVCEIVHGVAIALAVVAYRRKSDLVADWKSPLTLQLLFVVPASIALTVWLFVPAYWAGFSYRSEPPFATGTTEDGHAWIGSENPTLTVHEFTDYNCPHCKVASTQSLRLLPKNPGLRLVRRQHPRMRCRAGTSSCEAARVATCAADQGKFWQADRWLFVHVRPGHAVRLDEIATDLELDVTKLQACVASEATFARVDRDAAFAAKKRIVNIPGYVVTDRRLRPEEAENFLKTGTVPAGK